MNKKNSVMFFIVRFNYQMQHRERCGQGKNTRESPPDLFSYLRKEKDFEQLILDFRQNKDWLTMCCKTEANYYENV